MPSQKSGFERYSLSGNPFRDLAAETLDRVDIFHATQTIDDKFQALWEEISEEENKALVVVLAGFGMGKTQRLLLTAQYAQQNDYFWVMKNIMPDTKYVAKGMIEKMIKNVPLTFWERHILSPKWLKELKRSVRRFPKKFDPHKVGKAMAQALNDKSPSFILLNDLQNIPRSEDLDKFLQTLYVVANNLDPGVLIMISSNRSFFDELMKGHEALAQRFNIRIEIPILKDDEGCLLVARRLLAKRIVEDLEPLYPFSKQAVYQMNYEVTGNPRQLLKLADRVLDAAANLKTISIDEKLVKDVIDRSKGQEFLPPITNNKVTCHPNQGRDGEGKVAATHDELEKQEKAINSKEDNLPASRLPDPITHGVIQNIPKEPTRSSPSISEPVQGSRTTRILRSAVVQASPSPAVQTPSDMDVSHMPLDNPSLPLPSPDQGIDEKAALKPRIRIRVKDNSAIGGPPEPTNHKLVSPTLELPPFDYEQKMKDLDNILQGIR